VRLLALHIEETLFFSLEKTIDSGMIKSSDNRLICRDLLIPAFPLTLLFLTPTWILSRRRNLSPYLLILSIPQVWLLLHVVMSIFDKLIRLVGILVVWLNLVP